MPKVISEKEHKFFSIRLDRYNSEFFSKEFNERQEEYYKQLTTQQKTTQEDLKLYKKFRKIVEDRKREAKGKRIFFRFEDIEAIGVEYDLLFIYGAKNIGKTYATGKLIENLLDEPKAKIFMLRNSEMEIRRGFNFQLQGAEWPFTFSVSSGSLVRKPGRLQGRGTSAKWASDLSKKERQKIREELAKDPDLDPDHCGLATYVSGLGLSSFQGPSYQNLKALFWDECNDLGDLKPSDIKRVLVFLVSLERNNKDFKVYMTGNLLRHESGAASNIFFDFFGIPYDCNLKYFTHANGLKILYVNPGTAGDLYDGVNDQKFISTFGGGLSQDLFSNKPDTRSAKVLSKYFFLTACEPVLSFVFYEGDSLKILYLGSYTTEELGTYYIMQIEDFTPNYNHRGYRPFSDNTAVVNQFGNVRATRKEDVGIVVDRILKTEQIKRMFYADDNTCTMWLTKISEHLRKKYSEQVSPGF